MKTTLRVITEVERQRKSEIIKPAELIDIRPANGKLSLAARKYFNFMLKAAGSKIGEAIVHQITKKALRRGDKSGQFMADVLDELGQTIVYIKGVSTRDEENLKRVQLVLISEETKKSDDAWIEYEFPPLVRNILLDSEIYASLEAKAVHALRSKYALMLYEIGCKMKGRDHKGFTISMEEFRSMLNVPEGSLKDFAQVRNTILEKAKKEINQVADFEFQYVPIRDGRAVTKLELKFIPKSSDSVDAARGELRRHSAGRRARREGKVDKLELSKPEPLGRTSGIPGVPIEDLDRLMKNVRRPQDVIAQALEAERRNPGAGRVVIQQALTD